MKLSARTLIKRKDWAELIRSLDEGVNVLPGKFAPMDFNSIKTTCYRENGYIQPYEYKASVRGTEVTVTKIRRYNDEESTQ